MHHTALSTTPNTELVRKLDGCGHCGRHPARCSDIVKHLLFNRHTYAHRPTTHPEDATEQGYSRPESQPSATQQKLLGSLAVSKRCTCKLPMDAFQQWMSRRCSHNNRCMHTMHHFIHVCGIRWTSVVAECYMEACTALVIPSILQPHRA